MWGESGHRTQRHRLRRLVAQGWYNGVCVMVQRVVVRAMKLFRTHAHMHARGAAAAAAAALVYRCRWRLLGGMADNR